MSGIKNNISLSESLDKKRDYKGYLAKNTLLTILLMSVFVAVIIYAYYYINNTTKPIISDTIREKTEAEILIEKDLEIAYPATPTEVLRLHLRITKCLYNDKLSKGEIDDLVNQARVLYDEELLERNPVENQMRIINEEIEKFEETNKELTTYIIENKEDIRYWTEDDIEYASIVASTSFTESKEIVKVFEEFTLRRDEDGQWRILGWELSDKGSIKI